MPESKLRHLSSKWGFFRLDACRAIAEISLGTNPLFIWGLVKILYRRSFYDATSLKDEVEFYKIKALFNGEISVLTEMWVR